MSYSDVTSTVALAIALGSLGLSAFNAVRDRSKLKFITKFCEASEHEPARFAYSVVNAGRRPVVLCIAGGSDASGHWAGERLGESKDGIRLGEHERLERAYTKDDVVHLGETAETDLVLDVLWVEDSLGNRHEVPGSRAAMKRLFQ